MSDEPRSSEARIVLSYRRDDVAHAVDRIADRLRERFGKDSTFVDIDSIEAGADWVDTLAKVLNGCEALIVMIGPQWTTLAGASGRKLDDPGDPVRMEIRTALAREIETIPILIDGATMPSDVDLPPDIRGLARRQGIPLSRERFAADVDELMDRLEARLDLTASSGRRALAFLTDAGIVVAIASLLSSLLADRLWIAFLIFALYHVLLVAMKRRTLGKMLFGIWIDLPEDAVTRWLRALFRSTIGYSFSIFSGIGLLQFLLHQKHAAFHDLLFSTKVLRDRKMRWGFWRGVDEASHGLDERISAGLKRLGLFGVVVSALVRVFFGLEPLLRALTAALEWVVAKVRPLAGRETASTMQGVAGTASGKSVGLAALGIAPAVVAGAALSVASIAGYDSIAPRPLRIMDRTPEASIPGNVAVVKGSHILVLEDASDSMDAVKQERMKEMIQALEASGMRIESRQRVEPPAGGVQGPENNAIKALRRGYKEGIDTVVWISDFEDDNDSTGIDELRKEFEKRDLRLYLVTVSQLVSLARQTGGDIVVLKVPPSAPATTTGGAGIPR